MTDEPLKPKAAKPPKPTREDLRKAALKANMARRKAQAKARAAGDADDNEKNE